MAVRMLFFDLDGTLLDHAEAERQGAMAFAAAYGLNDPDGGNDFVPRWRHASEQYMDRFLAGEISFAEHRRLRMQEMLGRELANDDAAEVFKLYLNAYENSWRLYPDVMPCLNRLNSVKLGVITNGNREQQLKKLAAMSILEKFSLVVTSEDVGSAKPHPRIFHSACSQAAISPAECAYIGDRLDSDAHAAALPM